MKKKKYQGSIERTILVGMIVHDDILGKIARNLKGESRPFQSKWSNVISKWCLEHWAKYKQAPKDHIAPLFAAYSESSQDSDTVALVETFLDALSKDYEAEKNDLNPAVITDRACEHFNLIRTEKTAKAMLRGVETKDAEACREAFSGHEAMTFVVGSDPDPFNKEQIAEWCKDDDNEVLVKFPRGLGDFMGDSFERDSFISFAGPEKRGKSYWLMETVWQALRQKRNVLYYVTGDMSEKQVMRRLFSRATRRPWRTQDVIIPESFVKKEKEDVVTSRTVALQKYTAASAHKAMNEFRRKTGMRNKRLKVRIHPAATISAEDIESEIADLIKEDWVPDVVVIDYADVLTALPHTKHMEYRHQQNETWMAMRRISSEFHLCLVTATQTSASSYDSVTMKKSDFSEDKRKAAHVTGMLGINQTSAEKVQGIYRLNWMFNRSNGWADHQCVHTAGSLAIACPCIISEIL